MPLTKVSQKRRKTTLDSYWYKDTEPQVLVELQFKDNKGENRNRTETFKFRLTDWEALSDEQTDALFSKYHVSVRYIDNMPTHDVNYILGIYG
jgi:hypothetical protein